MPYKPVDTAIKVIVGPAIDDTDFKTREEALTYDQAGMEVDVILEKHDGTIVTTAVTPTTAGDYDWAHTDQGYYELELPASGGASFNNTEEGIITVVVYCTGVLPFSSVAYDVVASLVYDSIVKGTDRLQVDVREKGDANLALTTQEKADVDTEADEALTNYDPPTKAEMDTGHGLLATEAKQDTIDGIVDAILVDTGTTLPATLATIAGYIDTEVQAIIDDLANGTDGLGALKALIDALNDISTAEVNTEVDNALNTAIPVTPTADSINERMKTIDDHDLVTKIPGVVTAVGPTKAEMDTAHALLATVAKQDVIDGIVDAILADTGELQTDWANGGRLDLLIDAVLLDTGTTLDALITTVDTVVDGIQTDLDNATDGLGALKALIDALNDLSAADVNAEVVDALGTDTLTELAQAAPSATPTIKAAIMLIYMALRNKLTVTATELGVYNDAGTKIAKKTLSDDATTYQEAEMASGA